MAFTLAEAVVYFSGDDKQLSSDIDFYVFQSISPDEIYVLSLAMAVLAKRRSLDVLLNLNARNMNT